MSNYFNNLSENTKPYLREYFLDRRRKMASDERERKHALDLEIESRLLMMSEYREADTVLIYISRNFEISTMEILSAAFSNRKTVAAPRIDEDDVMRFYVITSLSDLEVGYLGILEPKKEMPLVSSFDSSLCICPALCCDMRGYRVGFGKGYYDRFLDDYTGQAVSLCYADSLIPLIKTDSSDRNTTAIVTDSFVRHIT